MEKKNSKDEGTKEVIQNTAKDYQSDPVKEIWSKSSIKMLFGTTAVIALLYASRYLLNGKAESIRAYKNLRKAMKEG